MRQNETENARKLGQAWERAVERAAEQKERTTTDEAEPLNQAAGLVVRSGVKGGWAFTNHPTCGAY